MPLIFATEGPYRHGGGFGWASVRTAVGFKIKSKSLVVSFLRDRLG